MLRLTIYRVGGTVEIDTDKLTSEELPSNKLLFIDYTTADGTVETIKFRPYYRKIISGVLNVFAEEEVTM